jgi:GNAT superfamily N-acetyltransferase
MITYQVEAWSDVVDEMKPLWFAHWEEVAMDHEAIVLAPDFKLYEHYEATGALHIVTARENGIVVGYHILIVRPHLHYANDLHAFTDVYYVAPAKRKGWVGIKLFKFSDRTLKQRGVKKIITATKLHLDMSRIFSYLGYRETERVFTKVL